MEIIDQKNKEWIEKVLSDLYFVNWDRFFVNRYADTYVINIFGWIDREDSYKDFIDLEFDIHKQEVYFIATSSAKYTQKIAKILGCGHLPCERIENNFKIKNSIILENGK